MSISYPLLPCKRVVGGKGFSLHKDQITLYT
nr:MAG TPA: hypothetical protein [Caudoviricetes sp.]